MSSLLTVTFIALIFLCNFLTFVFIRLVIIRLCYVVFDRYIPSLDIFLIVPTDTYRDFIHFSFLNVGKKDAFY